MNITKEHLASLGIISMALSVEGTSVLCFIRRHKTDEWLISVGGILAVKKGKRAVLFINFKDSGVHSYECIILDSGEDWVLVTPPVIENDIYLKDLYTSMCRMEQLDEEYGRRKEERIIIGKQRYKEFGLDTPEQKAIVGVASMPCAIVDASIHGVCVITPYHPSYARGFDKFTVRLDFLKEGVTRLLVHKVHLQLSGVTERTYAKVAGQLLEPIPYVWKQRVVSLLENHS